MTLPRSALLALSLALCPVSALAQTVSAADPAGLVAALKRLGHPATLEKDDQGDPKIKSTVADIDFSIWFYGCTNGTECTGLSFLAGFDLMRGFPMSKVNSWNETKLLGTAYLDDEHDPWLSYFVLTTGGISVAAFDDIVSRWEAAVAEFKELINF